MKYLSRFTILGLTIFLIFFGCFGKSIEKTKQVTSDDQKEIKFGDLNKEEANKAFESIVNRNIQLEKELIIARTKEDYFNTTIDEQSTYYTIFTTTALIILGLFSWTSFYEKVYSIEKEFKLTEEKLENQIKEFKIESYISNAMLIEPIANSLQSLGFAISALSGMETRGLYYFLQGLEMLILLIENEKKFPGANIENSEKWFFSLSDDVIKTLKSYKDEELDQEEKTNILEVINIREYFIYNINLDCLEQDLKERIYEIKLLIKKIKKEAIEEAEKKATEAEKKEEN